MLFFKFLFNFFNTNEIKVLLVMRGSFFMGTSQGCFGHTSVMVK